MFSSQGYLKPKSAIRHAANVFLGVFGAMLRRTLLLCKQRTGSNFPVHFSWKENRSLDARGTLFFPEDTRDSTMVSLMVVPLADSLGLSDYLADNTFGILVLGMPFPQTYCVTTSVILEDDN